MHGQDSLPELDLTVSDQWRGTSTCQGRLIIVASPRCGSNHLVSLLNSARENFVFGELFIADRLNNWAINAFFPRCDLRKLKSYRDTDAAGFLDLLYASRISDTLKVLGFKIFYAQHAGPDRRSFWDMLNRLPDTRVIHLYRRNKLAQFVSLRLAVSTGTWILPVNDAGNENTDVARVHVRRKQFVDYIEQLQADQHEALSALSALPTVHVAYEDLVSELIATIEKISNHTGIALPNPRSYFRKQRTTPLSTVVSNWDELKRSLAGTDFEKYCDDGAL